MPRSVPCCSTMCSNSTIAKKRFPIGDLAARRKQLKEVFFEKNEKHREVSTATNEVEKEFINFISHEQENMKLLGIQLLKYKCFLTSHNVVPGVVAQCNIPVRFFRFLCMEKNWLHGVKLETDR